jgi:glycosyltransferase involved in cell wall biosynthesis
VTGGALGSVVQSRAIAAGLQRRGHDVHLHFPSARQPGRPTPLTAALRASGPLRRYGHLPKVMLRNFPLTRRCLTAIDAQRPDVVLGLNGLCNFSLPLACRLRNIPLVLFCEEPSEYEYSVFFPQYYAYPALSRWVERTSLRSARQVVCISEVLKGYLVRHGLEASRIAVVPNGVDHRLFRPMPPDPELRHKLGLGDRLTVGFVGSFNFFPEVRPFLQECGMLLQTFPDVCFLFVGHSGGAAELQREAVAAGLGGSFVFAGSAEHERIPAFLSVMDVAISPYRADYLFYGSSMKILEYMAAGKVVLAPALGQIRELVVDRFNGLLYEGGDFASFGVQLAELLREPGLRTRLGTAARSSIESGWTWDIQATRIEHVLLKAMGRG